MNDRMTKPELARWADNLKNGRTCVLCDAPVRKAVVFNEVTLCSEQCRAQYVRLLKRGVLQPRTEEAREAMR